MGKLSNWPVFFCLSLYFSPNLMYAHSQANMQKTITPTGMNSPERQWESECFHQLISDYNLSCTDPGWCSVFCASTWGLVYHWLMNCFYDSLPWQMCYQNNSTQFNCDVLQMFVKVTWITVAIVVINSDWGPWSSLTAVWYSPLLVRLQKVWVQIPNFKSFEKNITNN